MSNDSTRYDAGNGEHVAHKHKAANTRRVRLTEAVRWIADDTRGRLYLAELVRESGALQRVVSADPQTVMFLDGQRSIGFKVLNDVRALEDSGPFGALVRGAINGESEGSDE
jgi:hypothetical protein